MKDLYLNQLILNIKLVLLTQIYFDTRPSCVSQDVLKFSRPQPEKQREGQTAKQPRWRERERETDKLEYLNTPLSLPTSARERERGYVPQHPNTLQLDRERDRKPGQITEISSTRKREIILNTQTTKRIYETTGNSLHRSCHLSPDHPKNINTAQYDHRFCVSTVSG